MAQKTVEILVFQGFDSTIETPISKHLKTIFNCKTVFRKSVNLPASAFYIPRNRYRADSLIRFLKSQKSPNANFILGLCKEDISVSVHNAKDWGVFGFGYCPGQSSVVSSYRLRKKQTSKKQFINRLNTVICHELGHNLGLPHCDDNTCIMQDAKGKISAIDIPNITFCKQCAKAIHLTVN